MKLTNTWVKELFANLENGQRDAFFQHVADNVRWQVMGTHSLARIAG
jgi:ketosteroid isomerase-like protein